MWQEKVSVLSHVPKSEDEPSEYCFSSQAFLSDDHALKVEESPKVGVIGAAKDLFESGVGCVQLFYRLIPLTSLWMAMSR